MLPRWHRLSVSSTRCQVWFKIPEECGRGRDETEALKLQDFILLFVITCDSHALRLRLHR